MITSLNFGYEPNSDEYGYTVGTQYVPRPGQTLKVYVPSIMSEIERENHVVVKKKQINSANKIFANASDCRPRLKTMIKETNAITAKMENNCSYSSWLEEIPNSTKVNMEFPNDSLANIYFNNNVN